MLYVVNFLHHLKSSRVMLHRLSGEWDQHHFFLGLAVLLYMQFRICRAIS